MAAVIQQSVLRGLTPGGVDFIAPGAAPAVHQVMSGVDIQDPAGLAALTAKPGFDDAGPALQITVPGPSDAVVEIKLYGRDGQKALPGGGVVTAKAGAVTEVSLAGVPAGQYTVAASSDVSFVAVQRVTSGAQSRGRVDVALSPAWPGWEASTWCPSPGRRTGTWSSGRRKRRATISYAAITADGKIRARGRRRHRRRHHRLHQGPRRSRRFTARGLPCLRLGRRRLRGGAAGAGRPAGYLNDRHRPRCHRPGTGSGHPGLLGRCLRSQARWAAAAPVPAG